LDTDVHDIDREISFKIFFYHSNL